MVQIVCRYLFSFARNQEANIGEHLKEGSNFEQRERKYANTWVVVAIRVVKNHSKITLWYSFLYLKQFLSTRLPLLCASKVATELWIHNFTIFRTVIIFLLIFWTFFNFQNALKISQVVFFGQSVLFRGGRFALSILVFEEMGVKIWVRTRPIFEFHAAVAVYFRTAFSLALFLLILMCLPFILSSTFQFK